MLLKKIIIGITIFLLVIQIPFVGACSNNNGAITEEENISGWKLVSSVTITSGGIEYSFMSERTNIFIDHSPTLTYDDWEKRPSKRDIDTHDDENGVLTVYDVSIITTGATSYTYNEPKLKGNWYHIHKRKEGAIIYSDYCRTSYKETVYNLVYINLVNDTTIKIKANESETTYTVTSYSIKYYET